MVINTKYSYGIALFTKKEKKLLLVRRRFSYGFTDFLCGKYDDSNIQELINEMTIDEKLMILNNDYTNICKVTEGFVGERNSGIYYTFSRNHFDKTKGIFDRTRERENGKYLKRLINNSKNSDLPWSIPKGRMNPGEKPLNTAMREFYEETGFSEKHYTIDLDYKRFRTQSIHNDIKYVSEFYIAFLKNEYITYNKFYLDSKIKEISFVKFMKKTELSVEDNDYYKKIKEIYNYV